MKRLLLSFTIAGAILSAANLATVRTVYMLPMGKSLDQYLANRLTNEGVFQVVTDPLQADAVFTDRIGTAFEQKLTSLLNGPKSVKTDEAGKPADHKTEKSGKKDDKKSASAAPTDERGDVSPLDDTVNKLEPAGSMSSLSRPKGTLFLVDAKTKQVLWSTYEPPRVDSSRDLDRTAIIVVTRLKRDLNQK